MDPLKLGSNIAGMLLENDQVRVIRGYLKPGEKAAMHSHPDHVVFVAKGSTARLTDPSGKENTMDLGSGQAVFMKAQSHEITNVGETDLEMIVVELK
jgi:quercetin dioxygenase-like cupin family protein